MKKIVALLLAFCSFNASAKIITTQEFTNNFQDYDACFMIYDVKANKMVSEYNPHNRCSQRIAANSTFKVPLSLMAFDKGIINQQTLFKWDGKKGVIKEHEQNQTPDSWMKYSVVWVSQIIAPQLGFETIKYYLANFHYGNQDISGDPGKNNGLTHSWLASSLQISALEQLDFLKRMLSDQLSLSKMAVQQTKQNMFLGKLNNGARYYGKTGSGRHGNNERHGKPSLLRDGWFVGFVEQGDQQYVFVSNLTDLLTQTPSASGDLTPYGSQVLKPITMNLLNEYFTA
jgi:beta-lactamase class D